VIAQPALLSFSRRVFLADLGRGTLALAIAGIAACSPSGSGSARSGVSASAQSSGEAGRSAASAGSPSAAASGSGGSAGAAGFDWTRVNLGSVSAYILARGGEAVVVDTGVGGSAPSILEALEGVGLGWSAVGHVVVTHLHGDHQGSLGDVLEAAPDAVGYAGAGDIPGIASRRPLTAVGDGDRVFGLAIVNTPGHTAGHIAVHDEVGGILVAGDALRTESGAPTLPRAQFTEDMEEAKRSIAKVAGLRFETLLVGHGDPITARAGELVAELAAG
jgi:glyoxylase-like metal-dependent hydrolase (beta-lactamase superfamily II)